GIDVKELLFDKTDAGIGRVLAVIATDSLLYAGLTVAWRPARRATGWLALPLGQSSLFAYGVQLFVVAFWSSELMAPVRLDRENALFQGAAVLMVWAVTRQQPALASLVAEIGAWRPQVAPRAVFGRAGLALATVLLA